MAGRKQADDGAELLQRGRDDYARRAWNDAYLALSQADQAAPGGLQVGEDLERLIWSAALSGRRTEFLRGMERLHHERLAAGDDAGAARWAFWLCLRLYSLGEAGQAGGWMARAQRLVADHDCVERGYLLLPQIYRQHAAGEHPAAAETAAAAIAIAERFGDADLQAFGRCLKGRAVVRQGRIGDGLAMLDETMVAAATGELSPILTGLIYCNVIGSCHHVYALDRAREWTTVLNNWCQAQPQLVTFTGACLVHRAEVLQLSGAWQEALDEARRAAASSPDSHDSLGVAAAFYQEAEILRLRGETGAAEAAYLRAREFGYEPQPGLALLRLQQGRRDDAVTAIRRVLGATTDPLLRTRLLPAYLDIALGAGDREESRSASRELGEIAAATDSEILGAMAAHAQAAVALAEGRAQEAVEPLQRAFRVWHQLRAPYAAACVRTLLARACGALGDHDAAMLELRLARETFVQLGAAPDVALIDALDAAARPRSKAGLHGLTARELEVLRLVATGKTNKVIAKELFLSEKTIDRHLSNIFTKVNVASRAAATAYAYEHGLI